MMRRSALLALMTALLCGCATPTVPSPSPAPEASPFDAEGYRSTRFRAPVDRLPSPAQRIALADALELAPGRDALFVDALPVQAGHRDAATGQWRLSEQHETIPGAVWHPETGRSPPDPLLWQGLVDAVAAARRAKPGLPVVVFCRTDCWMAWNASRRLAKAGLRRVYWLAEGIEGWRDAGRPLVPAEPVAIAPPR